MEESYAFHRSYIHPYFPSDIWRLIIPFLDGESFLSLATCCKDNYNIFISNTYHTPYKTTGFPDDEDQLATFAWELFCRQRWPSVKKFNTVERSIQNKNWWNHCYRQMHLQDKKVDFILSVLLNHHSSLIETSSIDLICQLFCSNVAVDELFDGLLAKCLAPTTTIPFITPTKVMAGLLLLEVNQVVALRRLCRLWIDRSSLSNIRLVEKGALLIAQFCQSVSELIQRKSLYTLEEDFDQSITQLSEKLSNKYPYRDKILNNTFWVEEMKKLFAPKIRDPSSSLVDDQDFAPFSGNTDQYYDWHNSLLDKVIMYRKGIPITLSIIYACIAHSAFNVDLHFIGLPGHFVLAIPSIQSEPSEMIFIDAFHGGITYTLAEIRDIVEMRYGVPWSEKFIQPLTPEKVWTRMIANIVNTSRDYSIPTHAVLLDLVKRRLDVTQFPPFQESDVEDILHRFVLLSPLCSYESNDILALTTQE